MKKGRGGIFGRTVLRSRFTGGFPDAVFHRQTKNALPSGTAYTFRPVQKTENRYKKPQNLV